MGGSYIIYISLGVDTFFKTNNKILDNRRNKKKINKKKNDSISQLFCVKECNYSRQDTTKQDRLHCKIYISI